MANSGANGTWFETDAAFWARVPLPIVAWKLWYADTSSFDSRQGEWAHAPQTGVQALMVYHPNGFRTVVRGRDAYTLPTDDRRKLGLEIDHEVY
jgi:hypothetical protein